MSIHGFPSLIGALSTSRPLAIAERAIEQAESYSQNAKMQFVLTMGPDRRVWIDRWRRGDINPNEWIATFNRKSDPDWLAEEIEGVMNA